MIKFTALLEKFGKKGEKTGWTYIMVRAEQTKKINPGVKKSFRVKGKLDNFPIKSVSLIPMGEGDFIMAINAAMRKGIKKQKGEKIIVQLELDKAPLKISNDFLLCLVDDKKAKAFFDKLPNSHQNYYSKWIESAKTAQTKAKRIIQAMEGFTKQKGFSEMMRENKGK